MNLLALDLLHRYVGVLWCAVQQPGFFPVALPQSQACCPSSISVGRVEKKKDLPSPLTIYLLFLSSLSLSLPPWSLYWFSLLKSRLSMSMGTGRASLGGGRHSMGGQGKSRRSSIHAASTAAQDPRPLTDPEFRTQCTRNLIEFLTQNGYGQ